MHGGHDTTTPTLEPSLDGKAPRRATGGRPDDQPGSPDDRAGRPAGPVKKAVRITAGVLVLLAGIAMLVLPGQGILTIAAGLAILAVDIPAADRLLRFVRRKTPGLSEEGSLPKSAIIMLVVMGVVIGAISVWWQLQ
ncbi:MAG: PGPGW domain-containing protein [Actinomycetota bacterium]|nr:PGPGW domain-containing protein [Actinomycetota bacterium]